MEGEQRDLRLHRSEGAETRERMLKPAEVYHATLESSMNWRQRSAKKNPPADDVPGLTMCNLMLC